MRRIKTIKQLKEEATEHSLECFISFGDARSSKLILWEGPGWWVLNYIDDTEQSLSSDEELGEKTMIIEAIDKGGLWAWE